MSLDRILKVESFLIEYAQKVRAEESGSSRLQAERLLDILDNNKPMPKPWEHFAVGKPDA